MNDYPITDMTMAEVITAAAKVEAERLMATEKRRRGRLTGPFAHHNVSAMLQAAFCAGYENASRNAAMDLDERANQLRELVIEEGRLRAAYYK